eukprot:gene27706-33465_t
MLSIILRYAGSSYYVYQDIFGNTYQDILHPTYHVNLTVGISRASMTVGNSQLIPGTTVHGAIILSDLALGKVPKNLSSINAEQWNIYSKVSVRIKNYRSLQLELPFQLTRWSGVIGPPCPQFPTGHKTERGLSFAHYMIWRDFMSFDKDTLYRFHQSGNSTTTYSKDGSHVIFSNGTRMRYGTVYSDRDILVILEDDALNTITDLNTTIVEELANMKNIDILYLGWCDGRAARPFPLCSHAYAITRMAARRLVKYFEPCGRALDEMLVMFMKNGWITHRRVNRYSYQKNVKEEYKGLRDKTEGIFRQHKVAMGSINGHRKRKLLSD